MKLQPKDFMIGDWVLVDGKPEQLTGVDREYVHLEGNCSTILLEGEVEPILLTTEILEKNGFAIKKKWAQVGNFGDSPLIMWHFEDDPILRHFKHELEIHQNDTGKVHIHIPCEFVHELQHALRLCNTSKEIIL